MITGFGNSDNATSASVAGNSISSLTTLALSAGHEFNQALTRRQNKLHSFSNGTGTSEVFFGEADDAALQARAEKMLDAIGKQFGFSGDDVGTLPQFWTSDYKRKGFVNHNDRFDSYSYDLNGFSGGMDMKSGENWNMGLAAGYTRANSNFEALGQTSTAIDAYQAGAYVTFENELGSVDSNLSFNKFDTHSQRSILDNTQHDMANAKGKGYQFAWTLSAMGHATLNKFAITPMTGFTLTYLHRGGLNENGAGLYDLNSASNNSTSLKPMIGADIARTYVYHSDTTITPEIYGIYRYETMDASERTNNHLEQFENLSSSSSTGLSRHSMQIGSSIAMTIGDRFSGKLQFDSDLQPSSHSYRGVFKINYTW